MKKSERVALELMSAVVWVGPFGQDACPCPRCDRLTVVLKKEVEAGQSRCVHCHEPFLVKESNDF